MIEIENKNDCYGCGACFNVCPTKAIKMERDEKGFLYPMVDVKKCINCQICEKICKIMNKENINNKPRAYACINKDDEIIKNSSSGGIFTLIANTILDMNGIVFGAQFDDDFNVVHSYIEDKEQLYKFRGSKYVQSIMGDSYQKAKEFLEKGRIVLFTGTPCQIGGLYKFLQKNYDNLYTQDIICHGVPSPKVWGKYKNEIENKSKSKIKKVNFRDKTYGWNNYSLKIDLENNKSYSELNSNSSYIKSFLSNLTLRDSCYDCKFKTKNRKSDITLADFWGIHKIDKDMYNDKGVSLLIINSKKGNTIFEQIKGNMNFKETDLDKAIQYNPAMIVSAEKPKAREDFFENLENENLKYLVNRYIEKPKFTTRVKKTTRSICIKLKII